MLWDTATTIAHGNGIVHESDEYVCVRGATLRACAFGFRGRIKLISNRLDFDYALTFMDFRKLTIPFKTVPGASRNRL